MATVRYFWHCFIQKGTTCRFLQYSRPLSVNYSQLFGRHRTRSALPSLLMFRIDRTLTQIGSSLELFRVARSVLSLWRKQIIIAWIGIRWVRWMFQNLPLPAAQEVRDSSSGVTPCIVMINDRLLYHQVSSFSPESMWLRFLHQSERTTARDPVQHKR